MPSVNDERQDARPPDEIVALIRSQSKAVPFEDAHERVRILGLEADGHINVRSQAGTTPGQNANETATPLVRGVMTGANERRAGVVPGAPGARYATRFLPGMRASMPTPMPTPMAL